MEQFRTPQTRSSTGGPTGTPAPPAGASVMAQARGHANVARMARDNCQQGLAAVQELHNRRNRSGE